MFNFRKHHDYLEQWQKAMATGLMTGRPFSEETQKSYVSYVTKFLDTYGKVSYENLSDHLGSMPVHQFCKKNQIHQALISFSKVLISEKAMPSSFLDKARKIKPRRHIPPKRLTVKAEDLVHLIQCCKNPLDRLIIILLASTGLRVSEACSLLVGDIDFESRKIHVRKGKWGKARRVGITDGLIIALQEYIQQWRKGVAPRSSPLLLNGSGRPLRRNGLYRRLKKLERRADVEVTPHALRRAFVTINVANGIPLVYLQIACGHSDITTTRSYCQTTEDEVIEAMNTRFTNFSSY
ncbi:MAG: tyrosine-type recombinase/integrase [Candidatus Melainabacteria bacterium]